MANPVGHGGNPGQRISEAEPTDAQVARSEGCSCYGRLKLNIARYMATSLCNRYGTGLPRISNAAAYVSSAVSNACCSVTSDRIPGADLAPCPVDLGASPQHRPP